MAPSITAGLAILLLSSAVIQAQENQHDICAKACAATQACNTQCDPSAGSSTYSGCLCQSGCLCNAEICLSCCKAAGLGSTADICDTSGQSAGGNILGFCGAAPAQPCYVYGFPQANASYVSSATFPATIENYITASIASLSNGVSSTASGSGAAPTSSGSGTSSPSPSPTNKSAGNRKEAAFFTQGAILSFMMGWLAW